MQVSPIVSVVIDTNVVVAAAFAPSSPSAKIVEAVRAGRLRMPWNHVTRGEIERVVTRIPPLRGPHARGILREVFRTADEFARPTRPADFPEVPDPPDREFAALAHAAGAPLVSNDRGLLEYPGPLELRVLTPGAFWRAFTGGAGP